MGALVIFNFSFTKTNLYLAGILYFASVEMSVAKPHVRYPDISPEKAIEKVTDDYKEIIQAYERMKKSPRVEENIYINRLLNTVSKTIEDGKLPPYHIIRRTERKWNPTDEAGFSQGHYLDKFDSKYVSDVIDFLTQNCIKKECSDEVLKKAQQFIEMISKIQIMVKCSSPYHNSYDYFTSGLFAPSDTWTPFIKAAKEGKTKIVTKLIENKIDVNTLAGCGCTALHKAAAYGHKEIAKQLLNNPNIDVNAKTIKTATSYFNCSEGKTALHNAVEQDRHELVILLLEHPSIDINAQDDDGNTVLLIAVKKTNINLDSCIKLLSHSKIDVNVKDKLNRTPLWWAVNLGNNELVKDLLTRKDINKTNAYNQDKESKNMLHAAVCSQNLETVKLIIDLKTIDVNDVMNDGASPLSLASKIKDTSIAQFLIEKGARVDGKPKSSSNTP